MDFASSSSNCHEDKPEIGYTAVPPHQNAVVSLPAWNHPVHSQSDQKMPKEKEKRLPCSESKAVHLNAESEKTDTEAAAESEVTADTEQKSDNP